MKINFILVIAITLSSCQRLTPSTFDKTPFEINSSNNEMLCFDLQTDDQVRGALFIKSSIRFGEHNVLLPFSTEQVSNSLESLSSNGSYRDFTIINYKVFSNSATQTGLISFIPMLNELESENAIISELDDGIYLAKSGLERKFLYLDNANHSFQKNYSGILFDTVDFLAIRTPEKSRGIEMSNGKTAIPDPKFEKSHVKYFQIGKPSKVVVSYLLAPSKGQKAIYEWLIKLLSISLVPLIQFFFIKPNKILSAKRKKAIAIIAGIIEGLAVLALAYFAFLTPNIETDKISDFIAILVGGAIAFFTIRFGGKTD